MFFLGDVVGENSEAVASGDRHRSRDDGGGGRSGGVFDRLKNAGLLLVSLELVRSRDGRRDLPAEMPQIARSLVPRLDRG